MKIVTRKEAKARGLKRYFTAKPCKHGHIAERYVKGADCFECKIAAARKKYKTRRNAEISLNYYYRNREKQLATSLARARKIQNLIAVLRTEMPDLIKEFGL